MIYYKPTLYRDVHDEKQDCLYVKQPYMGRVLHSGMVLWLGVRHWFGPFYISYKNPDGKHRNFADWPNNFEKV